MSFNNIKVGTSSLQNITTGDGNIIIGDNSGINLNTHSNNVYIGHNINPVPQSNQLLIQQNGTTLLSGDFSTGQVSFGDLYTQFSDIATPSIDRTDASGRLYKKTGNDGIFWLPDAAGIEVDLTSVGGTVTLQEAYNISTNPEFILDTTRHAITIRDAETPIGANLLEVQNNTGDTTYLGVTDSGISIDGNITVIGTVNGIDIADINTIASTHISDTTNPHGNTLTQSTLITTNLDIATGLSVSSISERTVSNGVQIDGVRMRDSYIEHHQIAAPTGVNTNMGRMYYNIDGTIHFIADDNDIETDYDLTLGGIESITAGFPGAESGSSGLTLSSNPITTNGSIAISNTTVTAGSYINADITVDQEGRITAASDGNVNSLSGISTTIPGDESGTSGITLGVKTNIVEFVINTSWTVPTGITTITATVISGGGGGGGLATSGASASGGGGGGALSVATFAVTPAEILNIVIGVGGSAGTQANAASGNGGDGGESSIVRTITNLVRSIGGSGGSGGGTGGSGTGGSGGTVDIGVGGSGGVGGTALGTTGGGGGGAGGYSGTGGTGGGVSDATSGTGGAGGGAGSITEEFVKSHGGGVGQKGEGSSGIFGVSNSPGQSGSNGSGNQYGAGGSGRADFPGIGNPGGQGYVRIEYETSIITMALAQSGVIPGSYISCDITVDDKGRVTSASNGSLIGTGVDNSVVRWDGTNNIQSSTMSIDDSANITSTGMNHTIGEIGNSILRLQSDSKSHIWIESDIDNIDEADTPHLIMTNNNRASNISVGIDPLALGTYVASNKIQFLLSTNANSNSIPPKINTWTTRPIQAMLIDQFQNITFGNSISTFSGSEKYRFTGPDSVDNGPNLEIYADGVTHPLTQILIQDHDSIAIGMGCYYNGNWVSSSSLGSFLMYKFSDIFEFNYQTSTIGNSINAITNRTMLHFAGADLVFDNPIRFSNNEPSANVMSYYESTTHTTTLTGDSTAISGPVWNIVRIGTLIYLQCGGQFTDSTPVGTTTVYNSNTHLDISYRPSDDASAVVYCFNNVATNGIIQVSTLGNISLESIPIIDTASPITWNSPKISYMK